MVQAFPKLRVDGSFSVIAAYRTTGAAVIAIDKLANWIRLWLERENPWVREWSSGKMETLSFYDDFREPPVVAEVTNERVRIRFEGLAGASWWKDWVSKFTRELVDDFPGIVCFESCEDAAESASSEGEKGSGFDSK